MVNKIKLFLSIILIVLVVFVFLKIDYTTPTDSLDKKYNTQVDSFHEERIAKFLFYDSETNCSLDGKVYVEEYLLGESMGGIFLLKESESLGRFFNGAKVSIIGETNYCFGNDAHITFKEVWIAPDLEYYFQNEEALVFETEVDPRWPTYPEEMQSFVRPNEVVEKLKEISINENDSQRENIDKIFGKTYMNWVSDNGKFGQLEYWQTPSDFIRNKGGDCEDWSVYFLSMLREYDPTLNCYVATWYTHANVLCRINKTFIIMDQDKIQQSFSLREKESIQENQINARSWRNGYFENFGIESDERILFYLFNEKEIIKFENGQEDFIEWVLKSGGIY